MTNCRFEFDDGAYVLGALAPAERADFERHLPGCPSCRRAVASLAVLPGLLSRLDAARANPSEPAPPSLLPRTLQAVIARRRAERRRRTWYAIGGAVAAAALAAVVGLTVNQVATGPVVVGLPTATTTSPSPANPVLTAMRPARPTSPVSGEVGLVPVEGGTRIDMTCRYAAGYEGRWTVRLVVIPANGGPSEQVGTWTAASGSEVKLQAITHFTLGEIGRIEVQRGDATALLTWTRI
jgi:hypothetical protein